MEYIINVSQSNKGVFVAIISVLAIIGGVLFLQSKNANNSNQISQNNNSAVPAEYNFSATQAPKFSFPNVAYAQNLKDKTTIYNASRQKVEANLSVNKSANGTEIILNPSQSFTPGKYTLEVDDNGKMIKQDFTWGVLAINPNKSIYTPGETANLALAVLDEKGEMVCDAKVTLTITQPSGASATATADKGEIKVNPQCHEKKFTSNPDYETNYKLVGGVGKYKMELSAQTKNGTYSITDFLYVQNSLDFDVERHVATRIFPFDSYPVVLVIKANRDFNGIVTEAVPSSFKIDYSDMGRQYTKIESSEKSQNIVWNVNIKAGQTINVAYSFKAPQISPQFYLIGPLSFSSGNSVVFEESRSWQLAIDSTSYSSTVIADTPLSYWRLGEPSGTTATDQMGLQNGTYVNTPTLGVASGLIDDSDTAVTFTAASSEDVTVSNSAPFRFTGQAKFSAEAWFKHTPDATYQRIMSAYNGSGYGWEIFDQNADFGFARKDASGQNYAEVFLPAPSVVWHHVVATYDGASMRIYIDGQLLKGPVASSLQLPNDSNFIIGGDTVYFNGSIDEVAIYNYALSAQQVSNHYNAGIALGGACTTYRSDNFNRGDQSNFGTASDGNVWNTYPLTSIVSNKGHSALTASTETSPRLGTSGVPADFDAKVMLRFSNHTNWDAEIRARYDEGNGSGNNVWIRGGTGDNGDVFIQERTGGSPVIIANALGALAPLSDNTDYYIRLLAQGNTVRVKAWKTTDPEPGWLATGTTTVTAAGTIGIAAFASIAVNFDWDDFTVNEISPTCGDFLFNKLRLNGLRIN